jgi:predicted peptidase
MSQDALRFITEITKVIELDYLLHLPSSYGVDPDRRWPLVLFLHGAGERGTDVEQVKKHGIPKVAEAQPDFPFVAISPQCPPNTWWSSHIDGLDRLLTQSQEALAIDPSRIYLTGLSMGGFGTWHLATLWPERFAAIVPICGGLAWPFGPPERVRVLRNLSVWAFHGAQDPTVPVEESGRLVKVLKQVDGDVRFTVYPDAAHDSWTRTYDDPALYEWMLAQQR